MEFKAKWRYYWSRHTISRSKEYKFSFKLGPVKHKNSYRVGIVNFDEVYKNKIKTWHSFDNDEHFYRHYNDKSISKTQLKDRIKLEESLFPPSFDLKDMEEYYQILEEFGGARKFVNESVNGYTIYKFKTEEEAEKFVNYLYGRMVMNKLTRS